ncbi:hypothetical protein JKP88DRAFT_248631 [Tribonema minus]|uniref:Uncharacterized protein n=1 Tax=Tribonema minus TaxID=303371 RepID=A0A835YW68_9STRA|nr:hypothetical protein JKP88DRAFT_248631 [Tribonema minus]
MRMFWLLPLAALVAVARGQVWQTGGGDSYYSYTGSYSYPEVQTEIQIFIYNEHPSASLFLHTFEDVAFSNEHDRVNMVAKPRMFIETSIPSSHMKSRMFFDAISSSYDIGPASAITMNNFMYLFGGSIPGTQERIESSFTFVDTSNIFDCTYRSAYKVEVMPDGTATGSQEGTITFTIVCGEYTGGSGMPSYSYSYDNYSY